MSEREYSDPATVGDVQFVGMANLSALQVAIGSVYHVSGMNDVAGVFLLTGVACCIACILTSYKMNNE